MIELVEFSLGREARAYLERALDQGTGLAACLLKVLPAGGELFAPLPKGVAPERAMDFQIGGLLRRRDVDAWLADHLMALCAAVPEGTFVVQDVWGARPGDPAAQDSAAKKFFEGEGVHYFLDRAEIDPASVRNLVAEIDGFLMVGAFVPIRLPVELIPADHVVDARFVENLARNVQEIYVSAYDDEGLIAWKR